MAVASIATKLPLATFAKLMGMHPLHFEQVVFGDQNHCDNVVFQHEWQTADKVSREEIARAIAEAESKIENALKYRLAPSWEVDEWNPTSRPRQPEFVRYTAGDARGYPQTVQADWGYFISGGVEAKTLIEAGAVIVYTDEDGDGYAETATVTVNTSYTDKNEIAAYYPGKDGANTWEIRPTRVSFSSGVATIVFRRELAVNPDLFEVLDIEGKEAVGTDDADFLETVDVYRHWNDPSTQVSLLWGPLARGTCGCDGEGCASCAFSAGTGCLQTVHDPRLSILSYTSANWDVDAQNYSAAAWPLARAADIARLYYRSGWRDKSLEYSYRMDPQWERTVAYMAAALLDRSPCDCVKGNWQRWRQDLTLVEGSADGNVGLGFFRNPQGNLDNPFGTTRGEVNAWRQVKSKIIAEPALL